MKRYKYLVYGAFKEDEDGYQIHEKNAQLIAAAPELLCVLGHLIYECETYCEMSTEGLAILKDAKYAIKKAKGE